MTKVLALPVIVLCGLAIGAAYVILHLWALWLVLSITYTIARHYLRPRRR